VCAFACAYLCIEECAHVCILSTCIAECSRDSNEVQSIELLCQGGGLLMRHCCRKGLSCVILRGIY